MENIEDGREHQVTYAGVVVTISMWGHVGRGAGGMGRGGGGKGTQRTTQLGKRTMKSSISWHWYNRLQLPYSDGE